MQCPKCGSYDHVIQSAYAADTHTDGSVHRIRRCRQCASNWRTREVHTSVLTAQQNGDPPPVAPPVRAPLSAPPAPLPTVPVRATGPSIPAMIDIEAEMEGLLVDAIGTLRTAMADKDPSRTRVELARYIVEDRRAHRRALADAVHKSGATHQVDDPATAQLTALLAAIGTQVGAES